MIRAEAVAVTAAPNEPEPARVRQQLDTLRRSRAFGKSARLMVFLSHIVEAKLAGNRALLTETAIGNAMYGGVQEYDARIDSTVRVEARRLRRKLSEYYGRQGLENEIVIHLPVGSYVPVFSTAAGGDRFSAAPPDPGPDALSAGNREEVVSLAVLPLRPASDGAVAALADDLTDELTFLIGRAGGCRVVSQGFLAPYLGVGASLAALVSTLDLDAVLQGTVRATGSLACVTLEVVDARGFIVWSDRLIAEAAERANLPEQMALMLAGRLRLDQLRPRS